jgi:hypothetical protein
MCAADEAQASGHTTFGRRDGRLYDGIGMSAHESQLSELPKSI